MRNTSLAGLEMAMMLPPLFTNRKSGMIVLSRFHDTEEATNCHDSVEWRTQQKEMWYSALLVAGREAGIRYNVSYGELLKKCFHDIENKGLKSRLRRLTAGFHGIGTAAIPC
jgi:hypothetical protein